MAMYTGQAISVPADLYDADEYNAFLIQCAEIITE